MPRALFLILACLVSSLLIASTGHPVSPLSYGPTLTGSSGPLIATNGTTFVEVWTANYTHPFASVFDREGHLLSAHGQALLLPRFSGATQLLAVGDNYLLIWQGNFSGYATILTPALDIVRTIELPRTKDGRTWRVAWNGQQLLLIAFDTEVSATGLFVDLDGRVLRSTVILRAVVSNSDSLDVVADSDGFAVLLSTRVGVYVQRVSATGTVEPPIKVSTEQATSAVAIENGGRLLVAWHEYQNIIHAAIVGADSVVGAPLDIPVESSFTRLVAAVPYGDGFALFSHVGPTVYSFERFVGWRIDATGDPLTATGLPTNIAEGSARTIAGVAVNGQVVLAVGNQAAVETMPPPPLGAFAIRADDPGAKPQFVAIVPRTQRTPAIATDGVDFLVAWWEWEPESRLAFEPLDAAGNPLRPDSALSTSAYGTTAVAFGGTQYLAVWSDRGKLKGATILPQGVVTATFFISDGGTDPAVLWDGRRFAVVWSADRFVYGTFITLDAQVAVPFRISLPQSDDGYYSPVQPDIAWNGHAYLVGWTNYVGGILCPCFPPPPEASLRLIDADGTPFGPVVRLEDDAIRIHLASNGRDFLAVTEHADEVRVTPVAIKLNQIVTASPRKVFQWIDQAPASVTFDGRDYVLALMYGTLFNRGESWLATARVHPDGTIGDRRFTTIGVFDDRESPAIAVNGANDVLTAVSTNEPEIGAPRVYTFRESNLQDLPPAPRAPTDVTAMRSICVPRRECTTTLTWAGSADDHGYLIEDRDHPFVSELPPNIHQMIIGNPAAGDLIRIRALGPGGISEASAPAAIVDAKRRRGARP